ncbi:MAG: hypothetical protein HC866_15625 [Leptolyngbyaceae cyanobacterium RU_5_1]|nr:hypothetical protein [Leptolyngbyaceae cyanobacterium RU_5_1]
MFNLSSLLDFSHSHCVAICTFLVPLTLLTTLRTLVLTGLSRPKSQIWRSAGFAIACAIVMILHVLTWLVIGVIMLPTYVLFCLGICSFSLNLWAICRPQSLSQLLRQLTHFARQSWFILQGVAAS